MKKIILLWIAIGLIFSLGGTLSAGPENNHMKGKKHKKEYCNKHHKKHGPPPHAPAHGYRHKHSDGVQLEFNASRNIYVVIDHKDHYYHGEYFFRIIDGAWKHSKHISGPWIAAPSDVLPPGLPPLPTPPRKRNFWQFFSKNDW